MLRQTMVHLQDENASLRKSLEEQRGKTLAAVLDVQHVQDEFAHFRLAADDEMTRLWSLLLKVESSKALLPLLQEDCSEELNAKLLGYGQEKTADEDKYDPPSSPHSARTGASSSSRSAQSVGLTGSPRSDRNGGLAGTPRSGDSEESQRTEVLAEEAPGSARDATVVAPSPKASLAAQDSRVGKEIISPATSTRARPKRIQRSATEPTPPKKLLGRKAPVSAKFPLHPPKKRPSPKRLPSSKSKAPSLKSKVSPRLPHAGCHLSRFPTTTSRRTPPTSSRRTPSLPRTPPSVPSSASPKYMARARQQHPPSSSPRHAPISPSLATRELPSPRAVRLLDIQRPAPNFLMNRFTFSSRLHFKESTPRSTSPLPTKGKYGTKHTGVQTDFVAKRSRHRSPIMTGDAMPCAQCPQLMLKLEKKEHFEQAAQRLLKFSQELQKDVRALEEDRAKSIRNSMNLQKGFVDLFKGTPTVRKSKVEKDLLTDEIARLKTNLITDTSRAKELKLFEKLLGVAHARS
eukprot:GEMP01027834.1.p1 GENE.GEMP01027834.1~~GEMP01027834.1.p1  ORF type:complete len:517 (+),score=130.30 GEMP01027834.1:89-1639(+)